MLVIELMHKKFQGGIIILYHMQKSVIMKSQEYISHFTYICSIFVDLYNTSYYIITWVCSTYVNDNR